MPRGTILASGHRTTDTGQSLAAVPRPEPLLNSGVVCSRAEPHLIYPMLWRWGGSRGRRADTDMTCRDMGRDLKPCCMRGTQVASPQPFPQRCSVSRMRLLEPSGLLLGVSQVSAAEIAVLHRRTAQVCAAHLRAGDCGVVQHGMAQCGAAEIRASSVGRREVRTGQKRETQGSAA